MKNAPEGKSRRRIGDAPDRVDGHRLGDRQDNDNKDGGTDRALEQIEVRLRERNQFPSEEEPNPGAAQQNEGVSAEPEFVRGSCLDLRLATGLGERFAHLFLLL